MMNKKEPNPLAFVASSERVNREVAPGAATRLYVDTEGVKKVNTAASYMNLTSSSRERVGSVIAASVVDPPIQRPSSTAGFGSFVDKDLNYAAADPMPGYNPVAEAEDIAQQAAPNTHEQQNQPVIPRSRSPYEMPVEAGMRDPDVPQGVRYVEDLRADTMAQQARDDIDKLLSQAGA